MSIPNDDPEYLFNLIPDSDLQKASIFDLGECSIAEVFDAMRKVGSWKDLEPVMNASAKIAGAHDVLRSIFLDVLKSIRHFQMENCTSMSNFCTTRASGSFAVSASTLSDDLDCTRVIKALSSPPYDEGIAAYLMGKGRNLRQETGCMPLLLPTFKVSDFFGHKSKLKLLGRLMDAGLKNIDWSIFFESPTVDAYKNYVREQLFRKKFPVGGIATFSYPATGITGISTMVTDSTHGRISSENVPSDFHDNRINDDQIDDQIDDPFMPRDNNWREGAVVYHSIVLELSPVYIGTLTKNPIYEDTLPYSLVKKNNAEEA
jgi:hypothetical protein